MLFRVLYNIVESNTKESLLNIIKVIDTMNDDSGYRGKHEFDCIVRCYKQTRADSGVISLSSENVIMYKGRFLVESGKTGWIMVSDQLFENMLERNIQISNFITSVEAGIAIVWLNGRLEEAYV